MKHPDLFSKNRFGKEIFTYRGYSVIFDNDSNCWRDDEGWIIDLHNSHAIEDINGYWFLVDKNSCKEKKYHKQIEGWPGPFKSKDDAESFLEMALLSL